MAAGAVEQLPHLHAALRRVDRVRPGSRLDFPVVPVEHVDVLLIDLRIPDMRGDIIFEVAAATQPQLAYQTVFMTGDITEKAASLVAACKCVLLRKPFDLADLFDAIAAIAPNLDREKDQTA